MILAGALVLLMVSWLAVQVLTASWLGVPASIVQLGMGPGFRVAKLGETELRVGIFPGGFVKFERLELLPFGRFCALTLLPWFGLGVAAVIAGARFDDFVKGATIVTRIAEVFAAWGSWSEALRVNPMISMGQLAARFVAVNLLPVGTLAGGAVIMRLLPEPRRVQFQIVSMIGLLVVMVLGAIGAF